jgi:E3 ubiquitin-protein ligase UBR7
MSSGEATSKSVCKRRIDAYDGESEIISIKEVLEQENELETKAVAVLGACDETNCSYDNGYTYRQALYCCLTCLKAKEASCSSTNRVDFLHGICLACSYDCHQNHELLELWTKRNFRCDCGNSKFALDANGQVEQPCKLRVGKEEKDQVNSLNKYNHNFDGLYCTCNKPEEAANDISANAAEKEKPDDESEDDMHQCTICEDWFHTEHLEGFEEANNCESESDNCDLVCHLCMRKNDYLREYQGYLANKVSKPLDENQVEVLDTEGISDSAADAKTEIESGCFLEKQKFANEPLKLSEKPIGASFFLDGWRNALCKCSKCLDLYKEKDVEFLIKPNDSLKFYEECGKEKDAKKRDEDTKLIDKEFTKLNRITQIELIRNVNDFSSELKKFFESIANAGRVITSEDVNKFFEELHEKSNDRKKRKLEESSGSGYFCK